MAITAEQSTRSAGTGLAELRLVQEATVGELLGEVTHRRLEASGVLSVGEQLYVIFDNTPDIAVLDQDLRRTAGNRLLVQSVLSHLKSEGRGIGYEDIARDALTGHFYVLIEALRRGDGYQAMVQEFDERFGYLSGRWLDFALPCANKGLEGLTCLHRGGTTYLLGLCEGNRCRGAAAGRRPGGGRVQVFASNGSPTQWEHVSTLRLPATLAFRDYSSLSVSADRLAVVSQESSALWVGRLSSSSWSVEDAGVTYLFPRDEQGRIVYATVEGVSWIGERRVAVVSDRTKAKNRDARTRAKEQSVHIFDLP